MKQKIYACDFETTVDYDTSKQDSTEVWSACFCEVGTEDAIIIKNIEINKEYVDGKMIIDLNLIAPNSCGYVSIS